MRWEAAIWRTWARVHCHASIRSASGHLSNRRAISHATGCVNDARHRTSKPHPLYAGIRQTNCAVTRMSLEKASRWLSST
eukprot:scaffold173528_cov31-Tisochrysis_lutea.AAC.1